MFGQINGSRWTLLFAIVLTVVLSEGTKPGRSHGVGPTQTAPNLTGKWKLDSGETIEITHSADQLTAKFSPPVPCWDLQRTLLFSGQLKTVGSGDSATFTIEDGQFWACTRQERMWKECGVEKLFETKFRANVTPSSITGENLRPGYFLPGNDFKKCRPDSQYEEWAPFSLTPVCRPTTYSGEITCDCNGDGVDETTKSFESCGTPGRWPATFKSRCEDWVQSDGTYSYGTDSAIQREGRAYLTSLKCPSLKCYAQYKSCSVYANDEYEKCTFSGVRRVRVNCFRQQTAALNKCKQNRDKCLSDIRKFGPAPRPQPLPTPGGTPTP